MNSKFDKKEYDASALSPQTTYAISFLDNGGNFNNFPKRHKKLYRAIEHEAKRRLMVEIRYFAAASPSNQKEIYTKIHLDPTTMLKPVDFYKKLDKLSYNRLLRLLHRSKGVK